VRCTTDPSELLQAFEPEAFALGCHAVDGGFSTNLELLSQHTNAGDAIRELVTLIERLPPKARAFWNAATQRDFSIGIEAGSTPSPFEEALNTDVLILVAGVGARIVVVVYSPERVATRRTADGAQK